MESANANRDAALTGKIDGFIAIGSALEDRQIALEEENRNLKFEINRLRNDVSYLMGEETAGNLIIENCHPEVGEDSEGKIRSRLLSLLREIKVQIEPERIITAKRLGKVTPGRIQPILIKLSEPSMKKIIFPVAKDLRSRFNIFINNDYSPPQREELFHVRTTKRSLLQNGINCYQRGFNLFINDLPYNWPAATRLFRSQVSVRGNEDDNYMSDSSRTSNNSKRKISPSSKTANANVKKPKARKTLN